MPRIKYAIFDVGNTIYPFSLRPLIQYMQEETSEPELFASRFSPRFYDYNPYMKGEISDAQFIKELCLFCRVPYHQNRLAEISAALHAGCGQRFPATLKALRQLQQNNVEICLLSNALPLLADTGADLVKPQYAFTSYDLKCLKPDLEIFKTVLNRLHAEPSEVLFIDDKKANVAAAQSLNINGIIYHPTTILKALTAYRPPLPNFPHSREV